MTSYREATTTLRDRRAKIAGLRKEMREIQAGIAPEPVEDYQLQGKDGPVRLSELFGAKQELFAIHNMGASCPYCTLWADGYNGVYDHLADRAAFVVTSPDRPEQQAKFAAGRGWRFPMVSHHGTSFAADMGYRSESGGWLPGISVFRQDNGRVVRVSDTALGLWDDFCLVWHMLDLLPEGPAGWQPRYSYA